MLLGFAIALERIEDENLFLEKRLMDCGEMACGKNVLWMDSVKRNIWDILLCIVVVSRFRYLIPN